MRPPQPATLDGVVRNLQVRTARLERARPAVSTGLRVEELENVSGTATDGDTLVYDDTTGLWIPGAAGGGALPSSAIGFSSYMGTGGHNGASTSYGFSALPIGSLFHVTFTLDDSSGTVPFTLGSPAYSVSTTGGWMFTNVSILIIPNGGSTITGGTAYTPVPAGITGKFFTQLISMGARSNGIWGGTMSGFSRWPSGGGISPLSVQLDGSGTASFYGFGDYGTYFQATKWQT